MCAVTVTVTVSNIIMTSAWILLVALMASVSFRSVDGSAYVRWGRTSCHGGASLVYKGEFILMTSLPAVTDKMCGVMTKSLVKP